jgi:hypothetical protein
MQILKINGLHTILCNILKWLRNVFSQPHHDCDRALINGCLEWMYDILISPVANFLDNMEQEKKLIIVAPEVCSSLHGTAKSWCESSVCVHLFQLRTYDTQKNQLSN